tara:strand:- start:513 stop:779 length:267 start_codon:yes stop_codon:yes gene_type:complete
MIKNYLTVRLSNRNNPVDVFDLTFKFRNHPFVAKWQKQFLLSQQRQDPISEPWAIYETIFGQMKKLLNTSTIGLKNVMLFIRDFSIAN